MALSLARIHMNTSFFNRIKYVKERVGVVEKDGKTYVKYIKVHRFRISSGFKYAILWIFMLVVLGLGIRFLMSSLASSEPAEETVTEET